MAICFCDIIQCPGYASNMQMYHIRSTLPYPTTRQDAQKMMIQSTRMSQRRSHLVTSSHLPADVMVTNRQRNMSEDLVQIIWIAENCGVEADAHLEVMAGTIRTQLGCKHASSPLDHVKHRLKRSRLKVYAVLSNHRWKKSLLKFCKEIVEFILFPPLFLRVVSCYRFTFT